VLPEPTQTGPKKKKKKKKKKKVRVVIAVLLCSQALVYVSTAYSQCPRCEIREDVYPVPLDYQQMFYGKKLDEETVKKIW
jgi:hypothetical protein